MSRSSWKGPVFKELILHKISSLGWNKKIYHRNCNLPSLSFDDRFLVYNGNVFKKFLSTKEKVGFKFGFFSNTRKFSKNKIKS